MQHRRERPAGQHPAGGYVLIRAGSLWRLWAAYHAKVIGMREVRVWLACQELVARRTAAQRAGVARHRVRYTLDELHRLVGGGDPARLRRPVRCLERSGFLQWNGAGIRFPGIDPSAAPHGVSGRRLVPVPRRMLRFLAGGVTMAVMATALGHLLRCAFYRSGACSYEGCCKASWVAGVFGCDTRSVKRARAELVRLGWLVAMPTPQWRLNRYGGRFRVTTAGPRVTPPLPVSGTPVSPPESHKQPLRGLKNQKPGIRRTAGVQTVILRRITREQLRSVSALLQLFEQACKHGWTSASQASRLEFVAMARKAMRAGTRNPAGLFVWLVRGGHGDRVSGEDEAAAARALARYDAREASAPPPGLAALVESLSGGLAMGG